MNEFEQGYYFVKQANMLTNLGRKLGLPKAYSAVRKIPVVGGVIDFARKNKVFSAAALLALIYNEKILNLALGKQLEYHKKNIEPLLKNINNNNTSLENSEDSPIIRNLLNY